MAKLYLGNQEVSPAMYSGGKTLTVINNSGNVVNKDDKVWVNTTNQVQNFNIVGSSDTTNGIASNFSTSDYVVFLNRPTVEVETLEVIFRFKYASNTGANSKVISPLNNDAQNSLYIQQNTASSSAGAHCVIGQHLDSGWWEKELIPASAYSTNTWFTVKAIYDKSVSGNNFKCYYKKDSDTDWILHSSASRSSMTINGYAMRIGGGFSSSASIFSGYIDLNQSYIKINGEYWVKPYNMEDIYPKEIVQYNQINSESLTCLASETIEPSATGKVLSIIGE